VRHPACLYLQSLEGTVEKVRELSLDKEWRKSLSLGGTLSVLAAIFFFFNDVQCNTAQEVGWYLQKELSDLHRIHGEENSRCRQTIVMAFKM
jgi:hypothetical protein